MSDNKMMKPSNKAALPALVPKSTRIKSMSISRFIFPLFLTVAFMACFLNFNLMDGHGLSSMEENNPVLLALRDYNLRHNDMGPSTRSMSTVPTPSTGSDSDPDSGGLELEQSPPVVVVEPIPNPEPADGHDTFSACMLVM
jgi:hypothetical protein